MESGGRESNRLHSYIAKLDHVRSITLALPFAVLWVVTAVLFPGFLKGDEVEILDTALSSIGYTQYQPWGIRHLLLGEVVVGGWLRIWNGGMAPLKLLLLATIPSILGGLVTVMLLSPLSRQVIGTFAGLAIVVYGLHWVPLTYGTAPFPRPMTVPLIVGSCILALKAFDRPVLALLGGVCVGLAGASRYSEWIYLIPLIVLLGWEGNRLRTIVLAILGFSCGALLLVLYDWWSWGSPAASLVAFVRYTFIEGRSSSLDPHQSFHWYLGRAHQILAPPLWPFLWLAVRDSKARRITIAFVVVPIIILSLVHHKELRYLQAVIPFIAVAVAAGAVVGLRGSNRRLYATLLLLGLAWSVIQFREVAKRPSQPLEAAQLLAEADPPCVALMQPWLYGHKLFLPAVEIQHIDLTSSPDELAQQISRCGYAAVFEDVVVASVEQSLAANGLVVLARIPMERTSAILVFGSDDTGLSRARTSRY